MSHDPAPEGPRSQPPADGSWRTDSLAGSRHSRLVDSLQMPADDTDPGRAANLCAEVARNALQDLAPMLLLVPAAERARSQILLSYTVALFDFALQRGVEGERLAALNRWEFNREMAFDGSPPGQPIFVALTIEHRRLPFSDEAFDGLASLARQVAVQPRPRSRPLAERRWRDLGQALAGGLLSPDAAAQLDKVSELGEPNRQREAVGSTGMTEVGVLVGAAVRLRRLQDLPTDRSLIHSQIPLDDCPAASFEAPSREQIDRLTADECRRLRSQLTKPSPELLAQAGPYRRALLFLSLAGRHLLDRMEDRGGPERTGTLRIGLPSRLILLARALRPIW